MSAPDQYDNCSVSQTTSHCGGLKGGQRIGQPLGQTFVIVPVLATLSYALLDLSAVNTLNFRRSTTEQLSYI